MIALLDIEIDGVQQIQGGSTISARYVFIKPPSLGALCARSRSRVTESEEDVLARLARARNEIEFAETRGVYGKIVINADLERAFAELEFLFFKSLCERLDEQRSVSSVHTYNKQPEYSVGIT
jgi:guanylate kinase